MKDLGVGPEEIVEAVDQVRNPETGVEDYSFLDEMESIPAPEKKKGYGLANWISYLAVYEKDDEIKVEEELLEEADRILSEKYGKEVKRFENIARDSEARGGSKQSLEENRVDGHERILEWAEDFYKAIGKEDEIDELYKNTTSLSHRGNTSPVTRRQSDIDDGQAVTDGRGEDTSQNPSKKPEGGENEMGRIDDLGDNFEKYMEEGADEYDALTQTLQDALGMYKESEEALSAVQTAVQDLETDVAEAYGDLQETIGEARGIRETVEDELSDTQDSVEHMRDDLIG